MGRFLVKLEDRYFEWSTIIDAPVTVPMTLDELKRYIRKERGAEGLRQLGDRLARIEASGLTSRFDHLRYSLEDLLCCNRAGPKETPLTEKQLRAWARGELVLE